MRHLSKTSYWVVLLIAVGVVSRWVPHPPNFTAFMAIALLAGFSMRSPFAMLVPVATVFLGDLVIGFHDLMWVVYLSLLPMVWLGRQMPELNKLAGTWLSWGVSGLAASSFFFVATNLAVWWTSGMYTHDQAGLVSCFILAIPFFHNSVLATWIYMGGLEAVRRFKPALFGVPA